MQSILSRRRIEAQILAHVHQVLVERSGKEEADAVIGETCSRAAVEQGEQLAAKVAHQPDLSDFSNEFASWTAEDALEVEVLQQSAERLDFNVVRCRYAEMYSDMGVGDIGHLLSCNRDGKLCEGYNPDIELTRTQTIMGGASHCDFRFTMKRSSESPRKKGGK